MVRILTWVSEFCDTKIIVVSHAIYKITYLTLLVSTSSTSSSEENIPDPGILCTNGIAEFKYYLYLHLPQIYQINSQLDLPGGVFTFVVFLYQHRFPLSDKFNFFRFHPRRAWHITRVRFSFVFFGQILFFSDSNPGGFTLFTGSLLFRFSGFFCFHPRRVCIIRFASLLLRSFFVSYSSAHFSAHLLQSL